MYLVRIAFNFSASESTDILINLHSSTHRIRSQTKPNVVHSRYRKGEKWTHMRNIHKLKIKENSIELFCDHADCPCIFSPALPNICRHLLHRHIAYPRVIKREKLKAPPEKLKIKENQRTAVENNSLALFCFQWF